MDSLIWSKLTVCVSAKFCCRYLRNLNDYPKKLLHCCVVNLETRK